MVWKLHLIAANIISSLSPLSSLYTKALVFRAMSILYMYLLDAYPWICMLQTKNVISLRTPSDE